MKTTLNTGILSNMISPVLSILDKRSVAGPEAGLQIKISGSTVIVTASNPEISYTRKVETDPANNEDGKIALNAAVLMSFLKNSAKTSDVTIVKESDEIAKIVIDRLSVQMNLYTEDFFQEPPVATEHAAIIPSSLLRTAFSRVAFCAYTGQDRVNLIGVHVSVTEKNLQFTATNGHQLGRFSVEVPPGTARFKDFLITNKAIKTLQEVFQNSDDNLTILTTESIATFANESASVTFKLIAQQFPDVDRIMPAPSPHKYEIENNSLLKSTELVSAISLDKKTPRIELSPQFPDTLNLTSSYEENTSSDSNHGTSKHPLKIIGEPPAFAINGSILMNILSHAPGPCMTMSVKQPDAPIMFTQEDGANENNTLYLLMPMR